MTEDNIVDEGVKINPAFYAEEIISKNLYTIPETDLIIMCYHCGKEHTIKEYGDQVAVSIFKVCPVCKNHIYHLP